MLVALRRWLKRLPGWYKSELQNLLSEPFVDWLNQSRGNAVTIRIQDDRIECTLARGRNIIASKEFDSHNASEVNAFLASQKIDMTSTPLKIVAPAEQFLVRSFDIPGIALPNLTQILKADIERKTPFDVNDLIHGYTSERIDNEGKTYRIAHYLFRMDFLLEICSKLSIPLTHVSWLQPNSTPKGTRAPLIAVTPARPSSTLPRRIAVALTAISVAATLSGFAANHVKLSKQQAELEEQIVTLTPKAFSIRKSLTQAQDDLARLNALVKETTRYPRATILWNEITTLLPNDTWLTEFRLSENGQGKRTLSLQGLSASAAGLVPIISRSKLFSNISLDGAILPDPLESRERFNIQMTIKSGGENAPDK